MKIKLIWTDSLHFFAANLPQIASLCLPWLVAGAAIEYLIASTSPQSGGEPTSMWAVAFAFNLVVLPIYSACLILLMAKQAQNQHPPNRELFTEAIKVWRPFFLLYILGGSLLAFAGIISLSLVTQFSSMLIGAQANPLFGLVLIFPFFLWIMARVAFVKFKLVLDHLNPVEAIQKSFDATRPHVRLILSVVLPYAVPLIATTFLIVAQLPETEFGNAVGALIGIAASFLMLFVDVLLFRIYMDASQENKPDEA